MGTVAPLPLPSNDKLTSTPLDTPVIYLYTPVPRFLVGTFPRRVRTHLWNAYLVLLIRLSVCM